MSSPAAEIDGRLERTAATRRRILEEARALLFAGISEPTAREIADSAEITTRTLFRHFSDMASLYRSLVEEAEREVMAVRDEVFPGDVDVDQPLEGDPAVLLQLIIDRRTRVYETILPLYVSQVWARYRASRPRMHRGEWMKRGRERLAEALPKNIANDEELFNAIDATLSIEYWVNLRRDQHLSIPRARAVLERAVKQLTS